MTNFSANQNLPEPGDPKKGMTTATKGCLGCLGLVVAIVLLAVGCSALAGNSSSPSEPDNSGAAKTACEEAIGKRLKSPSTAQYQDDVDGTGNGPFTVTGTVDSENSFGAMLRSSFQCTVTASTTTVDYLN